MGERAAEADILTARHRPRARRGKAENSHAYV